MARHLDEIQAEIVALGRWGNATRSAATLRRIVAEIERREAEVLACKAARHKPAES